MPAASDRHAARLAFQRVSVLIAYYFHGGLLADSGTQVRGLSVGVPPGDERHAARTAICMLACEGAVSSHSPSRRRSG